MYNYNLITRLDGVITYWLLWPYGPVLEMNAFVYTFFERHVNVTHLYQTERDS